ncbi:MAG: polysaccharide biosynthesis tyrosine autokinase, partial [Nitrospira sp.]
SQQIDIMPVRGARLAHITVSSEDSKFAAEAANTLVSVYMERTQELGAISKEKAARWFTEHLEELRKKVEASQQALYLFRSQHGLLEGPNRQTVAAQKITELNSELMKAEMKKAEAQTRYQQIKAVLRSPSSNETISGSNPDSSTEVLNSSLIQSLRAQEIKVSGQVAELSEKYGPLHPKLTRAKSELQDLREKLQQEVQKIYDSMKHEYDVAVGRERAIKEAVARNKKDKSQVEQYEIEQGILEREAESSQHLYDIFLKIAKEADLSSGMRPSNVYLADPAVPSVFPVKPKKKLNAMLGLLVGLMTGMGAALVLETRDRSLKNPDDVERYLPNISLFGVVPRLQKSDTPEGQCQLLTTSTSPAAESYRTIRTRLLLSTSSELPSSVLITSPGENEGKTTLAVNLATAMAQLEDTHVVLIDADLRKPNTHTIFQIENGNGVAKGLVDFLLGDANLGEIIHRTNVANLSVIPRGHCPLNPSELLHSKPMSRLIKSFLEQGYHVILDAPPVLPVTDPVVLAPQVDGVLLVIGAGETTREACRLAIQRLRASGGKFLGLVLQKARSADLPYYSTYYGNGSRSKRLHEGDTWIASNK